MLWHYRSSGCGLLTSDNRSYRCADALCLSDVARVLVEPVVLEENEVRLGSCQTKMIRQRE